MGPNLRILFSTVLCCIDLNIINIACIALCELAPPCGITAFIWQYICKPYRFFSHISSHKAERIGNRMNPVRPCSSHVDYQFAVLKFARSFVRFV
jgi:hypothetical protein